MPHQAFDLILASTSPRREQLLREAGYSFRAVSPEIEESSAPHFTPRELTLLNARRKAHSIAAFHPTAIVLGADTVVAIDGHTLGKPADLQDARRMLALLAGRNHEVLTSIWLVRLHPFRVISFTDWSTVYFRPLDQAQIDAYLAKIEPLDKAGAYAAQEHADLIIDHIEGSVTNIIGLPMEAVRETLGEFRNRE